MDHYAADASAVSEHLNLRNAVHIGHSTGGGEVTRYVARHGEPAGRVAKAVLINAIPPVMVKSESNPGGQPLSVHGWVYTLGTGIVTDLDVSVNGPEDLAEYVD